MSGAERKLWSASAHERKVENLYSGGIENYADWHNGYLNFGLWEEGIEDYIKAAENLVHRMGTLLGLNETSKLLDVAPGMGTQDVYLSEFFAHLHRRPRRDLGTHRARQATCQRSAPGRSRALSSRYSHRASLP